MIFDTSLLLEAGKVIKHAGFEGDVIVRITLPSAKMVRRGAFLYVQQDGNPVPYRVQASTDRGEGFYDITLNLVDSEEKARRLVGLTVMVGPELIKKRVVAGDTGWVGYTMADTAGNHIGVITGVEDIPGNPLLRVDTGTGVVLVPAAEEWVASVDEEKKLLVLDLPEGLLGIDND